MGNPSLNRKRKRRGSDAVINPLSHPPSTLKQFARAGYPADSPLPSKIYHGFPHRGPRASSSSPSFFPSDAPPPAASKHSSSRDLDDNNDDDLLIEPNNLTTTEPDNDSDSDPEPETDATLPPSSPSSHLKSPRRRLKSPKPSAASLEHNRKAAAYRSRVGWLAAIIRRSLADGDLPTAKRAFGLLARARVYGRGLDLRYERVWEWGAEVLAREGEGKGKGKVSGVGGGRGGGGNGEGEGEVGFEGVEESPEEVEKREEEKLERLKTYFGYLIQQYPYSKQHAGSARHVIEFQVAMFSAEMEAAYAAQKRGLERLQRGDDEDDGWVEDGDGMDIDEPMGYGEEDIDGQGGGEYNEDGVRLKPERDDDHLQDLSRTERRLRSKENDLRLAALRRMSNIAQRMDAAMEMVPFSRDHELLRLRAMVALYMGDLSVPPAPRSATEEKESRTARRVQRRKARDFLRKIKEGGGDLKDHDEMLLGSLESDDEEDEEEDGGASVPMFSSMGAI